MKRKRGPSLSAMLRAETLRKSRSHIEEEGPPNDMYKALSKAEAKIKLEVKQLTGKRFSDMFNSEKVDDEERVAMMDILGDYGSAVRESFSWACPDERSLRILQGNIRSSLYALVF